MNRSNSSRSLLFVGLSLGLLLALASAGFAADDARNLSAAKPEDVGMSSEGLAAMDAALHSLVDEGQLSGVITAVARHGKLVHWDVYGKASVEENLPMTDDSIFRIYSMTKPIVGVALMTLYEQGKFQLDDPVSKYIPQLEGIQVAAKDGENGIPVTEPANHEMTIRELVSHTGGLTYGLFARSQVDTLYQQADILSLSVPLSGFIDKLAQIPLKTQPGSTWEYSVSVDVQGYLVEVLSGMTLEEYLQKTIFTPLGMKDTGFWVPPAKADRLARLYNGQLQSMPNGDDYLTKPALFMGGGGAVSTAMDYLRFAQMVLNGGELDGVRILKPETVKMMHTNQLPDGIAQIHPMVGNPGNTFGIDFAIVDKPTGQVDHLLGKSEFWWYGIGGTWFGINPTQDTVIVGMIQSRGGAGAREARIGSKKAMYDAITKPGS